MQTIWNRQHVRTPKRPTGGAGRGNDRGFKMDTIAKRAKRGRISFGLLMAAIALNLMQSAACAEGFAPFVTPKPGSADRTQILALMRKPMESVFGKPIEFDVRTISVSGIHAFAGLHPQRPGGAPLVVDFACEVDGPDIVIEATFIRKNGVWTFENPADGQPEFCADDVTSWDEWLKEKHLPPQFIGRQTYVSDTD